MKRKIIVLCITILSLLSLSLGVYAYYKVNNSKAGQATTNMADKTAEEKIEVDSFLDLLEASKASVYNDSNAVSVASARKIIILTADITLIDDVVFTSDIHIDLGTHTLDLNNYMLTIQHGYAGCFLLYNGTVQTKDSGLLVVDLPNAGCKTDGVIFKKNTTTLEDTSNCFAILNLDSKYTAYSAFYMVGQAVSSNLNHDVEFKDYFEVHADSYDIENSNKYLSTVVCESSSTKEICSFVYQDLDLPKYYLSTNIKINYLTDKDTLSSTGAMNLGAKVSDDVNLTASVTINDTTYSCVYKLHLVDLTDTATREAVGLSVIKTILEPYYVNGSIKVNESLTLENYYDLNHGVELPISIFNDAITFTYTASSTSTSSTITTSSHINENVYVFEPNNNCYYLNVSINGGTATHLKMYSTYVGNYETIARLILNKLYGGTIIYNVSQDSVELTVLSQITGGSDATLKGYVSEYGISNISYSLVDNHNDARNISDATDYFEIADGETTGTKKLITSGDVDAGKYSALRVSFTFTEGESSTTIYVDLNVEYVVGNEDNVAGYFPVYTQNSAYLRDIQTTHSHSSSESVVNGIEMPFAFEKGAPYTVYDFATVYTTSTYSQGETTFKYYAPTYGIPAGLKVSIYYDGAIKHTFTDTGTTSLTIAFDTWLASSGLTLATLAAKTDCKWLFQIDYDTVGLDNQTVLLIYNYKYRNSATWTRYETEITFEDDTPSEYYLSESTTSFFTVKGGVYYKSNGTRDNCVKDSNFFVWMYNKFNPDKETINTSCQLTQILIPSDWLTVDIDMDATSDTILKNVSDFQGIGALKKISSVNLSGKTLTTAHLTSIASMSSVTELIVSNCGITSVDTIATMTKLKYLDISNNKIQRFDALTNITGLEVVYLYGQTISSNTTYYGEAGLCNYQTYVDLMRNGCSVYNSVSNGVPGMFANVDTLNDYKKLSGITYQDTLSSTADITTLYSAFRGISASTFGLSNTSGTLTWGYEAGKTVQTATYFYVNYTVATNTVITVKYYVTRT